ncbi:hypothetical protein Neosp_014117 [[Neocosmospora] mangrovei]
MGDFSESVESRFRLKIPFLGTLAILKKFSTRVNNLWTFPYDPMSQNLAIQAVLVYKHLKDTRAEEPYATPRGGKHHPVPDVPLYIHPFRFISAHYAKDVAGSSSLAISDYNLDGKRVLTLAGFVRSGSPDIATEHWIEILPHQPARTTETFAPYPVSLTIIGKIPEEDLIMLLG